MNPKDKSENDRFVIEDYQSDVSNDDTGYFNKEDLLPYSKYFTTSYSDKGSKNIKCLLCKHSFWANKDFIVHMKQRHSREGNQIPKEIKPDSLEDLINCSKKQIDPYKFTKGKIYLTCHFSLDQASSFHEGFLFSIFF